MPTSKKPFRPAGQLWLSRDGENVLNDSRIALLEQIGETGSITKAGQAVGISYRTAWITIDHLNTLSDSPLVEKTTGGKSGGGTQLTEHGVNLIRVYRIMQKEHQDYLDRLREGIQDFDRFLHLTRKISLKTSARNQLFGVVESIRKDALNAVVILRLKGKDKIISQITVEGLESLGLRKGEEAYALIKANWITLSPPLGKQKSECENELVAKIIAFKTGEKKAEVVMRLPGGNTLVAMVSLPTTPELPLTVGSEVRASFQASDVILGVAR
jgi:molybdate transport system regulatory protein